MLRSEVEAFMGEADERPRTNDAVHRRAIGGTTAPLKDVLIWFRFKAVVFQGACWFSRAYVVSSLTVVTD